MLALAVRHWQRFFRIWLLVTLLTKLWISPFFFFAKQYLRLLNILANLIFTPVAFEEGFGFFLYPTWPNLVTLFPEDLLLLFSSGILHPKYQALLLAGSSWASEYLCTMGIFGCFSSENAFNHFRFYHWFLTIFGESYDFSTILDNFLVISWVFSFTVGLFLAHLTEFVLLLAYFLALSKEDICELLHFNNFFTFKGYTCEAFSQKQCFHFLDSFWDFWSLCTLPV